MKIREYNMDRKEEKRDMERIDYANCTDWRIMFDNPSNTTELKKKYRIIAKRYHPDTYKDDKAFKNIGDRYREAIEYFEISCGSTSGMGSASKVSDKVLAVRDRQGKGFDLQYIRKDETGGNTVYTSKSKICLKFETDNKELYENYLKAYKDIDYPNDEVKKSLSICFPKNVKTVEGVDGYYIIMDRTPEVISLRQILDYYEKTGKTWENKYRHCVWIINRIYNMACLMRANEKVFNGFDCENLYVSPKYHTTLLLNGWQYCVENEKKMIGTTQDIFDIMSITCKDKKLAEYRTDTESVRMIGRELFDKDAPKEFREFFEKAGSDDAIKDWQSFEKLFMRVYGERKFFEFNIDSTEVLQKA